MTHVRILQFLSMNVLHEPNKLQAMDLDDHLGFERFEINKTWFI